jgi:predicted dehydrogenase
MIDVVLLGVEHGPHARSYARGLGRSPIGRLVGVYDASPELGAPLGSELGTPYFADADDLIEATRPVAAIVCSATNRHRELVELAATRGLHVLSEKPLATSIEDAAAMVELCHARGVQLHTAFVSRFYPVLLQARDIVARGEIGRLRGMVGGNRGRPPLAPRYPPWITNAEAAGGGALIDHSVHVVDAMRFVSGLEAQKVMAETGTLFTDLAVEDSALVSIVFGDGVPASVDPSWSATATNVWSYDFYLRLLGTEGSLSISTGREALQVSGQYGTRTHALEPFEPDVDQAQVEAFLQSVSEGRVLDPCATGVDGLRAVEVACAAYASVLPQEFVATAGGHFG